MSECGTVEVNVRLAVGDLYRFGVVEILRKFWWFLAIMLFAMAGVSATVVSQPFVFDVPNVVRILFFFIFIPYAFFVAPYLSARKRLRTTPCRQGPSTYLISPAGIDARSATGQAHIEWNAFVEARETSKDFLVYPQKLFAHLLPKRFFAGEADMATLRVLLREHVKGKVKLRT